MNRVFSQLCCRIALIGLLLTCAGICTQAVNAGQEYVRLTLSNGRMPVGQLVEQAEASPWVVLQSSQPGISLVSRFPKTEVLEITPIEPQFVEETAPRSVVRQPVRKVQTSLPVSTIRIKAIADSWDRDAELDGLKVWLIALDEHGNSIPFRGSVQFQLQLEQRMANLDEARFPAQESWSVEVTEASFQQDGVAVFQLPWQKLRPDLHSDLYPSGILTARLTVPGTGVFEARCAEVLLREPSRTLDDLEAYGRQPAR